MLKIRTNRDKGRKIEMIGRYRAAIGSLVVVAALSSYPAQANSADVRNVTPQAAHTLLGSNPKVRVLDIRTPREFRAGHIEGAQNINFYSRAFRSRLSKLDRNTPYLMLCRRGVRSGAALKIFRSLGFTQIIHLPAGMNGWRRAGLKVVK